MGALRLINMNGRDGVSINDKIKIASPTSYCNKKNKISIKHRDDEDEDAFIKMYRKKRLKDMKYNMQNYGCVIPITRTEWIKEVNEASEDGRWVIVLLTSQNSSPITHLHLDHCRLLEDSILPNLARRFPSRKFVSIPSKNAISGWPEDQLPTLFCYRYSKLQHQLLGLSEFGTEPLTIEMIECKLIFLGVLETDSQED